MPRPAKPFWKKSHRAYYANIGGKPVRLGTTWEEAEKEFHRLKFEQKAGELEASRNGATVQLDKPITTKVEMVVDVCTKYLAHVQKNRKERTYQWYRDTLKHFCKEVGRDLTVEELIPHHLTEWADRHHEWSSTTRFDYIRAVQGVFRWGIRQRLITTNPIEYVEKPSPESREIILTDKQWKAILASYLEDDPFRDLLVFARSSGARPQESKKIEARHMQQDGRVAVFLKKESKNKGKRRRNRVLYLPPPLRPMLQRLCEKYPEGPIFRNKDGNPWTTNAIRSRFRRIRKKLKIEQLFMYAIRHTWETHMLLEQPLQLVAELAGHDAKTAMATYHHPQFVLKEMLDKLDDDWAKQKS
ncbi:MAG: tyrosine-type recombinase/integrase [Planctomycetes bacterium]|nr:tyrosine-type recombinase/integrase [Planctomycetota bacterium]